MKIVHLITFLDSQTGGMERQALQLAKKLKDKGHNPFFITCIHWSKLKKKGLKFKDSLAGLTVYRIPLIEGLGFLNAFIYFFGAFTYFVFLRRRYSLIHAHQLYTSGLIACIVKVFFPTVKVIIKNCAGGKYGDINNLKKFPFTEKIIKFINKMTDSFIGVSNEIIEEMAFSGFTNTVFIPNGVDTEVFYPLDQSEKEIIKKRKLPNLDNKKIILFVGRLGPEKNIPLLIKAMSLVNLDAILLIVGKGKDCAELRKLAEKMGLQEKIFFLGSSDIISEFYQIADLFVLPSVSEGLPNVLLEAMSCGVPCIGSNINGIKMVIKHKENGYLFENNNVDQLKKTIEDILENKEIFKKLSENSKKTIKDFFSFKFIVNKYCNLYGRLININN